MSRTNGRKSALHLATQSGWHRFERRGKEWIQTDRALTYWSLTCLAVDPVDPHVVYAGSEHSGLFVTSDGGTAWRRASPTCRASCSPRSWPFQTPFWRVQHQPHSTAPAPEANGKSWRMSDRAAPVPFSRPAPGWAHAPVIWLPTQSPPHAYMQESR